jgi:hypothetical protein
MHDEARHSLREEREQFERHLLVEQYLDLAKEWQRTYCRMIRALADAFDEEEVLDRVEKVWWDMAYQAGLSWRERFEEDPQAAMKEKADSWHNDALWARICCCEVPVLGEDRWELKSVKCYREVFNEMGEPEIGMSWCMTDFAAVRGWSPRLAMRQPKQLLRGDNYCHQIRYITDEPTEQWDYSKELSEKVGWRSVRRLRREKES